ncbi:hypothetical protein MUY14_21630 [Amycolatopsis sp. FBCC-B4732]|uniref:hypothetical protein n=1 Tax=unclassified Amycolatopsis TaxID=2618356 RepID=UPI001FF6C2B0|nr:hypothetical protein [Amycolatopsis sp. FBCC-B4732]UOX93090.1 hypothetical protein MUY14_21630 [Amycolatopsis sp. FBCC-B4732]
MYGNCFSEAEADQKISEFRRERTQLTGGDYADSCTRVVVVRRVRGDIEDQPRFDGLAKLRGRLVLSHRTAAVLHGASPGLSGDGGGEHHIADTIASTGEPLAEVRSSLVKSSRTQ